MRLELIYGARSLVRQWDFANGVEYFADGVEYCAADALEPGDPQATAALKRSTAVADMVDLVRPYEAAYARVGLGMPDNGEPIQIPDPAWTDPLDGSAAPAIANPAWAIAPRQVEATDSDGAAIMIASPRWLEFDAAIATIDAASPATIALAHWRAGDPGVEAGRAAWIAAAEAALAERDRLAALPLAHDPRPAVVLTFLQFMALFAPAELAALVNSADVQIKLFLLQATGAGEVNLGSPVVAGGLDYITALGVIAPGRKAMILANAPHA
jgi:hypothetical protein